jgi:hypothetical protein
VQIAVQKLVQSFVQNFLQQAAQKGQIDPWAPRIVSTDTILACEGRK